MRGRVLVLVLGLGLVCGFSHANIVYEYPNEKGYHFYKTFSEKKEVKQDRNKITVVGRPSRAQIAKEVEGIKKELEYRKALALLYPTRENVIYLRVFQKKIFDQATFFSDQWMYVSATEPSLDETLGAPISQAGAMIGKKQRMKFEKEFFKSIGNTHAIFFFYKTDCPYSHAMAPIVKAFAEAHSIDLMAVSMDGKAFDIFPNGVMDNGSAEKMGVVNWPSVVLFDAKANNHFPPVVGYFTEDLLKDRLMTVLTGGVHGG